MSVRFTKREEIAANTPPGMPPGYRLPEHCRKGNNGKPCPYLGFADGLMCQYILITGESRAFHGAAEGAPTGCKPEECTHYLDEVLKAEAARPAETVPEKESKANQKKAFVIRAGLSEEQKAQVRARRDRMRILYEQGCTDEEIATSMGCSVGTVAGWRPFVGLPTQREKSKQKAVDVQRLWEKGLTDCEIAESLKTSKSTVQRLRSRMGLEANQNKERMRIDERLELYKSGLTDREIAEKQGVSIAAVAKWREIRGSPPNKAGKPGTPKDRAKKNGEAEKLESSGGALESSGTMNAADAAKNAELQPVAEVESNCAEPESADGQEYMSVSTAAELLAKIAQGWPDAKVRFEHGGLLGAISLGIDYDANGHTETVEVHLYDA